MPKSPEELLTMRFGAATVAQNLQRGVETGRMIENEDGTRQLAQIPRHVGKWITESNTGTLACQFLMHFLFRNAYAQSAVPYGCRDCYKVKVVPRTVRELVAAWQIAKRIDCPSKWGIDLDNRYSQDVYAGYFYASGLDIARAIFKIARDAFDVDPKLGPAVPMKIKRGCSEYEAAVGPSNRYEFPAEMEELEAYLRSQYRKREFAVDVYSVLGCWIDIAFRIGDDTYLDFTNGERLHPESVTYDP
jgi:hypothetical protein